LIHLERQGYENPKPLQGLGKQIKLAFVFSSSFKDKSWNTSFRSSFFRSYCNVQASTIQTSTKSKQQLPQSTIGNLEIRVGRIVHVERHPQADTLYVEKIDVGEAEPRTIISGLVKYMKEDDLKEKLVLVLCNLPAKEMRGIKSNGMVLAASVMEGEESKVALIEPPSGSKEGELISFDDESSAIIPSISGNKVDKILKRCKIDENGVAQFITADGKTKSFNSSSGPCSSSLINANIS
jgi:methionine--tRNA ligase beta chain